MKNNSQQSQRGSSDDAYDIMSLISDVDSASIDLIGQQQLSQIDSLKFRVNSLENELDSRNEESLLIKKRISQTSVMINQFVQNLLDSIDKEEQEKIKILEKIKNERNHYNKIDQYISFINNYNKSNVESFNRVCDQLRNHIQLIELLNSEENLPLSISSQPNYQQILLNEAYKTNEFLKRSIKSSSSQEAIIPPISEILNINNFSPDARYEKVQTLIYSYDIPIDELKTLLLQEIAITDILRKYISTNIENQNNGSMINSENEENIRNQIEEQVREEITQSVTEKVRRETENELRPKIEQELRLKIESSQNQYIESLKVNQKLKEDQYNQQIQELTKEIERLKKFAKDDLINEISNETDSDLRKKVVSILRGEIEASIRSEIEEENLNNKTPNKFSNNDYGNGYQNFQQTQEFEDRLQKALQAKEVQLRSQFNRELQQKENQIKAQIKSQFDSEFQQKENQIKAQIRSQFDSELQTKENQIKAQLRSQFDSEFQQKENQIKAQLRSQFDSEFQQKENQIKAQLHSKYDLDLQQKESLIRKQLRSQFDLELQQKENQIKSKLRSQFDSELQQKENQIKNQLRSQFDSELQQKENQIKNQLRSQFDSELRQKENQIKNQLRSQFDSELRQKENQIQSQLRSQFDMELQAKETQISNKLRSQFELEFQSKEKQIRKQLEPQIRSEIMNQMPKNMTNDIDKFDTNSSNSINEQFLIDLYRNLCDACGVTPTTFQMNVGHRKSEIINYSSNPLLVSIFDHASSLASDVSKFRKKIFKNKKGRFNFLNCFEELEAQVAHLDQLHTQTRALLIKQSQIISDLRVKTGSASWITWARNILKILNSEDQDDDENEVSDSDLNSSFSFKKGAVNTMDPDYAAELKLAIEEKAVAVMAKERMRRIRNEA